MSSLIDIFADLSASRSTAEDLQRTIARWTHPENLGAIAERATVVVSPGLVAPAQSALPSGWTVTEAVSPVPPLSAALAQAGQRQVALLMLQGAVEASNEAVGVLQQCLQQDPMFGFAAARVGCVDGCCIARLSGHGVGATEWMPRRTLGDLPEFDILVEFACPCLLIAPDILGNFGPLDRRFVSVAGAMLHYMAGARRCGFRTVLCNRAMVGIDGLACSSKAAPAAAPLAVEDRMLLRETVPDLDRTWQHSRSSSSQRFERLSEPASNGARRQSKPSLLLDVRNVGPIYNGTSQAVLGIANGIKTAVHEWDVTLLVNPDGAHFHNFASAYPDWPAYVDVPDRAFTATMRPSQPWHIQEMIDLHHVSLFNAYMMLDTIAWDVGYCAPAHLEGTWQFLAHNADGLLFDSDFTRLRFLQRFPAAGSVPSLVTHLSFDPKEYIHRDVAGAATDNFILVVGNSLDHKDVGATVEALATAFPFRRITSLGPAGITSPFVTSHRSGELPDIDVHRLYASAEYVVFPSFYEGFGFPILTALAYGRTVLTRRSSLVSEVASRCYKRGRLIAFDRREELVDLIGALVHGVPVPEYPLGEAVSGTPKSWRDVGRETLEFLEALVREPARSRWVSRDRVVRQLTSYRA
jgi:glycosyltransferase involved in cell wall biosynthesis